MNMIPTYFHGERTTGWLFTLIGVLAIGLALWGWRHGAFWRGAAGPLVIVARIQIGVGASVWRSSAGDLQRVQQLATHEQARVVTEEIPRMQGVMKSFSPNRWVELTVLAAGLLLAALASRGSLWQGVGAGLAVQAALVLLLDTLAERRGQAYLQWLQATFS